VYHYSHMYRYLPTTTECSTRSKQCVKLYRTAFFIILQVWPRLFSSVNLLLVFLSSIKNKQCALEDRNCDMDLFFKILNIMR